MRHVVLPALLVLCGVLGDAQQQTGEIHLQIRDPSGAPMNASGKLENSASGIRRAFETDTQGEYIFAGLPYGRYRLEVTRSGFAAQSAQIDVKSSVPVSRVMKLALETQATRVEVVATTPLPGTDLSLDQIAAPVQTVTAQQVQSSGALDLADFLNKRLTSIFINENQENPYQPDVNYRGYTASPLLGTPEGLSVYMDGVRQNQPFGDIVAWDLIPKIAIDEAELMPGSDPLYGLNTLGGALSIQTKSGLSHPGSAIQIMGGMFGRRAAEFENGGSNRNGLNWYVAGNLFREDGWRPYSPSEVRQAFGKLGWRRGKTSVALSFSYADNWLKGVGLQDFRLLEQNYSSVYTIPDITWDRSPFVNLSAEHELSSNLTFSGNAYFRYIRGDTYNANLNAASFGEDLYGLDAIDVAVLSAAGFKNVPVSGNSATEPFPYWKCIAQGLEKSEPANYCTGIDTNTYTKQNNYGLSGQATWRASHHHFTAGAAWDRSSMTFQQTSRFGYLNVDRLTITPINAFADGSTTQDGVPVDTRVDLHGLINTFSVYATDTISAGKWNFTVSGRYNRTTIDNIDRLPMGPLGSRGSLNGQYVFDRLNPAAGLTYNARPWLNAYFSYSESSRAPTAIELGCGNPDQPCNLPNALVSDPPLKQVVAKTFEAGVRGRRESNLQWSAGWFRGENNDDLLFVASEQTGFGYFTNFGRTRRQGLETNVSGRIHQLALGGGYTFLSATYQSAELVGGAGNSSNDAGGGLDGNIAIQPGDRIPLIPRHMLKAYGDWQATPKFAIDLDFVAVARSFARGNENNLDQPGGVYYLGPGSSPGYGVVNLGARYQVHPRVQLFAQINNLLDHHYYTAAQLAVSPYDTSGAFVAQPFPAVNGNFPLRTTTFYAPGTPFDIFGGLRFTF